MFTFVEKTNKSKINVQGQRMKKFTAKKTTVLLRCLSVFFAGFSFLIPFCKEKHAVIQMFGCFPLQNFFADILNIHTSSYPILLCLSKKTIHLLPADLWLGGVTYKAQIKKVLCVSDESALFILILSTLFCLPFPYFSLLLPST